MINLPLLSPNNKLTRMMKMNLENQARENMIKAVGYKETGSILDYLPQEEPNEQPTRILIKQAVAEEMAKYSAMQAQNADQNGKTGSTYIGSEEHRFYKLTNYIQTLIQVQGAEHNVHKELDEALLKLKELTYA